MKLLTFQGFRTSSPCPCFLDMIHLVSFARLEYFEIAGSVVCLDFILMMDYLIRKKLST